MIRLSPYPAREKITDDVDWKNIPVESWEMNFRPLRNAKAERQVLIRFSVVASVFAAVALVAVSVLNAMFPFLLNNYETVFLLGFSAVIPFLFAQANPKAEPGIGLYGTLVALLLISNTGLLFLSGYRDEFYSTIFLAFVIPLVLLVLDRVASLYVHWATASPMMDKHTMNLLREAWSERFAKGLFTPARFPTENRVGEPEAINKSLAQVANYPAYLIAVYLLCFASIFAVHLVATDVVAQAGLIAATLVSSVAAFIVASRNEGAGKATISAMALFCNVMTFKIRPGTIQYPQKYKTRLNLFHSAILSLSFAVNTFWFPWALQSFTQVGSASQLVFNVLVQFTIVFALAPMLFFVFSVIAIGPTIREVERLCEGDKALLANEGWSQFDGYNDRLSKSNNASEADSIWVGFHKQMEFPILIPSSLFGEHAHLLGGSGSGKTGLGLATLAAQLIKKNEGPVIIIDGKGDNAFFQSVRRWCGEENRKFKWFTTSAEKSTYLFNPLGQAAIEKFSLPEIVGFLLLSLNLFHGSDYGKGWFTQVSKTALAEAAKLKREGVPRPATLQLFYEHLEAAISDDDTLDRNAKNVLFMLQTLCEFPQLNHAPDVDGNPHSACEHAIDMQEVIRKNQVVYFSFDSLTDASTPGELSRMAVYSVISAAKDYKEQTSKTPKITIIVDEAQNIVAKNIGSAVEMARDRGISFVFSHQSRDQLKMDSNTDLRKVVDDCTQVKLHYSVSGDTIDHIQKMSGEVGYADPTWQQFVSDLAGGNASIQYSLMKNGDPAIADVRMQVGPRLTLNEIQDSSAAENECILAVSRKRGLAQYNGAFPIHIDYPITLKEYGENKAARWPLTTDETAAFQPHWPAIESETIVRANDGELPDVDIERTLTELAEGAVNRTFRGDKEGPKSKP